MAKSTPIDISYVLRKWTKEEKQQVIELREKGHGPKKIADLTGFPVDQIKFWIYGPRQKKKSRKKKSINGNLNSVKNYYRTKYNNWFAWKAQCYRSSLLKAAKETSESVELLPLPKELEQLLIDKHEYCGYCNADLTQENISLDHNIPTARGGSSKLTNLVICCQNCNMAKGALLGSEYKQLLKCISKWEDGGKYLLGRLKGSNRFYIGGRK